MRFLCYYIVILIAFYSCDHEVKTAASKNDINVIYGHGSLLKKDTLKDPLVVEVGKPKITLAGKPKITSANLNIFPAGQPSITPVIAPKPITPGIDTFLLPEMLTPSIVVRSAGSPEIVVAKDMANKDQNPANFCSFGKLQGLKHTMMRAMMQDRNGNIWIATQGAGVTRYDGKTFAHFTEDEGLINNSVWTLEEDKDGNIWMGTDKGVSKYDGNTFTNYTQLANDPIWKILQDKKGNIWICSYGTGVVCYDGVNFKRYTTKQGLAHNIIITMMEDRKGNLWFATKHNGVSVFDGKSFTNFNMSCGLANNVVQALLEDNNGNIWIGTQGGGMICYDGTSFKQFSRSQGFNFPLVMSLYQDKSNTIWIGSEGGGLYKYDGKTFTCYTTVDGLISDVIHSVMEDRSGNLWCGTDAGVVCYRGKNFSNFNVQSGLGHNHVKCIFEDSKGNMWFGTNGGGFSKYDGRSFATYTEEQGLSNNIIWDILEDDDGNMWFSTDGGGVCCFDGTTFKTYSIEQGLSYNVAWCSMKDRKGNLWFGMYTGGAVKYDGKTFTIFSQKCGLPDNEIDDIIEDKNGSIWFCSQNAGVTKFDRKNFTLFTAKDGLPSNNALTCKETKDGNIYFGCYDGGLSIYDGNCFINLNEKHGFQQNLVTSILEDTKGNMWFGNRFGLHRIASKKRSLFDPYKVDASSGNIPLNENEILVKHFSYADGFLGVGSNRNAIYQTRNGNIWVGANDRLVVLDPEQMKADTIAPSIQLTSLGMFNEEIRWERLAQNKDTVFKLHNGTSLQSFKFDKLSRWYNMPENLSLAYNNNYLNFHFIGITMDQPQKVMYQYKLEGNDESWSALTNKTEAAYGNLSHGAYTFLVKAMNSEGVWSNTFSYAFEIRPPWWQTWWFRIIAVVVIVACVWTYIKWREKSLIEQKHVLESTVKQRTAQLVQKQNEILDSINYAQRIQRALLASEELLEKNLNDYFIFYQPKDIVSGDFYWASELPNKQFALVTADSTGHGVPGAIMSMLNISCLEKSIEVEGLTQPSDILNYTRKRIIETLKKDGSVEGGKDGMDCSVISFDFNSKKMSIAGANNPILIVRDGQMLEFKNDKMPVGKHDKDSIPFTQQQVDLQPGDMIYAITDGVYDQFGGPQGKKFKYKHLKDVLLNCASKPLETQKEEFIQIFNDWKGKLEQVDDVTLIGIRV